MVDECIEEDDNNKNHNWKVNLQFLFYLGEKVFRLVFRNQRRFFPNDIDLFFSIHLSFAMCIFVENDLSSTM